MNSTSSQYIGRARGYCRVSTTTKIEGESLDTQKTLIQEYCTFKKLELIQLYIDAGASGKNIVRQGLQTMMTDVKAGEYVIISDLSRLSRSTKDALNLLEDLNNRKVHFICLSPGLDFSTPEGAMIFNVLMSVHRLERDNISKHVSANMQRLSQEGKLRTRPPFGFKFVGKDLDFEEDPDQQKVIAKIIAMYKEAPNYSRIASKLNEDGDNYFIHNNRKNVPGTIPQFRAEQIKRILIDHGMVEKKASHANRMPLHQRIVNHRADHGAQITQGQQIIPASKVVTLPSFPPPNSVSIISQVPQVPQVPQVFHVAQTVQLPQLSQLPVTKPISIPIVNNYQSDEDVDEYDDDEV